MLILNALKGKKKKNFVNEIALKESIKA